MHYPTDIVAKMTSWEYQNRHVCFGKIRKYKIYKYLSLFHSLSLSLFPLSTSVSLPLSLPLSSSVLLCLHLPLSPTPSLSLPPFSHTHTKTQNLKTKSVPAKCPQFASEMHIQGLTLQHVHEHTHAHLLRGSEGAVASGCPSSLMDISCCGAAAAHRYRMQPVVRHLDSHRCCSDPVFCFRPACAAALRNESCGLVCPSVKHCSIARRQDEPQGGRQAW